LAVSLGCSDRAICCSGVIFSEGINMYDYNYAPIDSSELYLDGVGLEGHVMIIDDILADRSPRRRQKLLLNPALLGPAMELHLTPSDTIDGRRVWLIECDDCLQKVRGPEGFLRMYEGDWVVERLSELAQAALLRKLFGIG
jgi:hypothetical protein